MIPTPKRQRPTLFNSSSKARVALGYLVFFLIFLGGVWFVAGPKTVLSIILVPLMIAVVLILGVIALSKLLSKNNPNYSVQFLPFAAVKSATKEQVIPMNVALPGAMTSSLDTLSGQATIKVEDQFEGTVSNTAYKAVLLSPRGPRGSTAYKLIEVIFLLPGPIAGKVLCHNMGDVIRLDQNTAQLESIEFNTEIVMAASPRRLASEVFQPDFMEWYLHTPGVPGIFLEGGQGTLIFLGANRTIASVQPLIEQTILHIIRSGALEK